LAVRPILKVILGEAVSLTLKSHDKTFRTVGWRVYRGGFDFGHFDVARVTASADTRRVAYFCFTTSLPSYIIHAR
jgi:hypothetical protein